MKYSSDTNMVYRVELKDTAKTLRKGLLQAIVPVCIIAAVVAAVACYGLLALIEVEISWIASTVASLFTVVLIVISTLCIRTDHNRDQTCFYTLTERGLMIEGDASVTFIPWNRVRALRLLPGGLLITNTEGLSMVHSLGDMPQEKRQAMLEYARQQLAAKAEVPPILPPAWAMVENPLTCTPSRANAQQTAAEMDRVLAPRAAILRLILLWILALILGAMGLAAATEVPSTVIIVLLIWTIWIQMRRVFHPGNRQVIQTLQQRKTESHVTPGNWLVRNADGSGAWGITRVRPEDITVRQGKGLLLFCLNNRAVLPVDDAQELPDWLPAPTQQAGLPLRYKILTILAPVVAALMFWLTYQNLYTWLDYAATATAESAVEECTPEGPELREYRTTIQNALQNPGPEQAKQLVIYLTGDTPSCFGDCSLTRREDGTWLLRAEFSSPAENHKAGLFTLHKDGYVLDYREE